MYSCKDYIPGSLACAYGCTFADESSSELHNIVNDTYIPCWRGSGTKKRVASYTWNGCDQAHIELNEAIVTDRNLVTPSSHLHVGRTRRVGERYTVPLPRFFCSNSCCQPRFVCLPGDPSLAALSALARRKFCVVCEGDEGGAAIYTHWCVALNLLLNGAFKGARGPLRMYTFLGFPQQSINPAARNMKHAPSGRPSATRAISIATAQLLRLRLTHATIRIAVICLAALHPTHLTPAPASAFAGDPDKVLQNFGADAELAMTTSRATSLHVGNSLADVEGSRTPSSTASLAAPGSKGTGALGMML
ncbi:hypothetical protein B0H17DRAFT_1147826 [Mycena rosella]|uniref:Uncharacterized protein n=1 Tax=Mycena rosella TaxID=1033263 RepID=A0AAD7G152_MYCRO|nr:hypothetical protein B0H17DRAFT_1147826 [Mycena rosella]